MNVSIVRARDCRPQPWKNGLGVTCEIAVYPYDAGSDDFLWRVSVAEVNSTAPFSTFPGIDRHIVLLEGAGFVMTLDETRSHVLQAPFEPFPFVGEASVVAAPIAGPTRDFNLMVRRQQAHGQVEVWRTPGKHAVGPSTVLIYAARGEVDTPQGMLHAGDAWLASPSAEVTLHEGAVGFAVRIVPLT